MQASDAIMDDGSLMAIADTTGMQIVRSSGKCVDVSKREYILSEGVDWSLDKINEEYERLDKIKGIIVKDTSYGVSLAEIMKHIKDEVGLTLSEDMINYMLDDNM